MSRAPALAPLRFLPSALRQPAKPFRAILVSWPTTLLPSIALGALVSFILPQAAKPEFHLAGPLALFMLVIVSPLIETLMMAGALGLLLRLLTPPVAIIVSSVGWGLAHSALAAGWGLVIWWPFLVFSTLYVVWRQRSLALALAMPFAAHALQNLLPAVVIAYGIEI